MRFKIIPEDDTTVIFSLDGDFTSTDTAELKQRVEQMMDQTGYQHLIIDLSKVTFLESASLGALNVACRKATKQNKRLSLQDPSDKVVSLLQITGLNRVFQTIITPEGRQRIR